MDPWQPRPNEPYRPVFSPPPSGGLPPGEPVPGDRGPVPGAVTVVSVYLWIGAVVAGLLALFLLAQIRPEGDDGILPLLAALFVANAVLNGCCAVMIRRASRRWRNVAIILMVLTMIGGLFQLPLGLVTLALNGFMTYLLAGTESSQRFFNGY
jgi:hypothetical protein